MWSPVCSRPSSASTQPLEAVKDKIVARLQGEKALAEAMRTAAERRKSLTDGAINPTAKTAMGIKDSPMPWIAAAAWQISAPIRNCPPPCSAPR